MRNVDRTSGRRAWVVWISWAAGVAALFVVAALALMLMADLAGGGFD